MNFSAFRAISTSILITCGCATHTTVTDPNQITDTGKANTVVLAYDITAEFEKRHSMADAAEIWLCQAADGSKRLMAKLTSNRSCIKMNARYVAPTNESTAGTRHVYRSSSTDVFQQKYGEYVYDYVDFRVLTGRQEEQVCTETAQPASKKSTLKVTRCKTEYKDIYDSNSVKLPKPVVIAVAPGSGCYVGTLNMHLSGVDMVDYRHDTTRNSINFRQLSDRIQSRLTSHVTKSCHDENIEAVGAG